ncbi:MAG: efflux RND transporter periplasmic adaptor subunit [Melioribacteraceae bacterium]|nr:efflux RND transporter periplasmic adaptor subunit [Melioribacteraceae bacterium]
MKINKNKLIISFPFVLMIISLTFLVIKSYQKEEIVITGIVEANEIDVASKIPGRIDSILVQEGNEVKKGQVLAILESKEMDAKIEQAKGMMEAARAKMEMTKKGSRIEEIEATQKLFNQAKAQYDFAFKTYERFKKLYSEKIISTQEMDEMEFKYLSARDQMEAAKVKLNLVNNGARDEEILATKSLFHQAENAYKEALAYYEELKLKAPVDGEVYQKISDEGEIINSGYPIFTLLKKDDSYVIIQVKENLMKYIEKDKIIKGTIPALNNNSYNFKVDYIAPMADFATWKPTNQKGDYDLKTFEVHLKSTSNIKNLRPGMTVNFQLN